MLNVKFMFIVKVQRGEEKPEIYKVQEKEEALNLAKEFSAAGAQVEIKEKK